MPSLLSNDEGNGFNKPFPRGGGSSVTPLDIKKATTEATRDVFDQMSKGSLNSEGRNKRKRHKQNKPTTAEVSRKPRIESLVLNGMKAGTFILGRIEKVDNAKAQLVMSLPNNLIGYVDLAPEDLNEPEADLTIVNPSLPYRDGQWLRCVVVGVDAAPHKRLQLSIEPSIVNQTIEENDWCEGMAIQAVVQSIEDRGAVISFGNSRTGFVSSADHLEKGQVFLGYVIEVQPRVTTVTLDPKSMLQDAFENQAALVPGCLVTARITEVSKTGLIAEVFERIEATIDYIHSHRTVEAPQANSLVTARVLFSHPSGDITRKNRHISLSLLEHTVDMQETETEPKFRVGNIINEARVVSIAPSLGLFLNIGIERPAFAHISTLSDTHLSDDQFESQYKVGTLHRARVISHCDVDDMFRLSLNPSVVDQRYLTHRDVQTGDIVPDATVVRILSRGGVIVCLSGNINGLVSEFHISDARLANPERRLKPGQKVSARILRVDEESGRIDLSLKKSYLNGEEAVLDDYHENEGKFTGTIVAFKPRGAVVEFFNGICGFLPMSEMSETPITDPTKCFRLGQSVAVRILQAIKDSHRLIVSCRPPRINTIPVGAIIDKESYVVARSKDELRLAISLEDGVEQEAILPISHLSDDLASAKSMARNLKEGAVFTQPLRLVNTNMVTAKESLLKAPLLQSLSDFKKGESYAGFVSGSKSTIGIFVSFLAEISPLVGLISSRELSEDPREWPKIGETIRPTVLVSDLAQNRAYFSLNAATASKYDSSNRGMVFKPGDVVDAVVTAVKKTQLNVQVNGVQGRVDITHCFKSIEEIQDLSRPLSQFSVGQTLTGLNVTGYHDARNHRFLPLSHRGGTHVVLELTANSIRSDDDVKLHESDHCLAFVNNITEDNQALWVSITPTIRGRISRLDIGKELHSIGAALDCVVLQLSPLILSHRKSDLVLIHKVMPTHLIVRVAGFESKKIFATDTNDRYAPLKEKFYKGQILPSISREGYISLRHSEVTGDKSNVDDPLIESSPAEGTVLRGFVNNIADGGLFVELGRNTTGRVQISQLADAYLKDWKSFFDVGQVVVAKVIKNGSRVELSLKESVISGKSCSQKGIENLREGQVLDGTVRKATDYGVFVSIGGTQISGLCHISEVSDKPLENLVDIFKPGDSVKIKILGIDLKKRQVSLGMKSSYFAGDSDSVSDYSDQEAHSSSSMSVITPVHNSQSDSESGSDSDSESSDRMGLELSIDEEESDFSDNSIVDADKNSPQDRALSARFDWDGEVVDANGTHDASSSDDSEDEDTTRRKRRKKETFVEDVTAVMANRLPQSTKDFERLLVANPNSSVLWMNYIASRLQLGEIDTARKIARRALSTIDIREQEEKFNIWIALMNLENSFGTTETVNTVFREAAQYNDGLTIYLKMASIFGSSGKSDPATEVFKQATRKFGNESVDVWIQFQKFLFDINRQDQARSLGEKALKRLPKRLHRDFAVKYAKMEYHSGDPERGRTLFEALVSSHSKRIDLWNVYLDQEMRSSTDRARVGQLFERIFRSVHLTLKQAKFMFKKWLAFETETGDEQGQNYIKTKAAEYVQALASAPDINSSSESQP